jgi:Cu(I)/Ag(I) efflux system membrane fusion protein
MFAQVEIEADPVENALLVPREAVIRTGGEERVVLALGEGRFRSTAVKLGRVGERDAEILDGLEAGDTVVVSAQFLLDSESSKRADLMRMDAVEESAPAADGAVTPEPGDHSMHQHAMEHDHD